MRIITKEVYAQSIFKLGNVISTDSMMFFLWSFHPWYMGVFRDAVCFSLSVLLNRKAFSFLEIKNLKLKWEVGIWGQRHREREKHRVTEITKYFLLTCLIPAQLGYYFSIKSKFIKWRHLNSGWIFLHQLSLNTVAQPMSICQPDQENSSWILFPGWYYVVSTWALRWTDTSCRVIIANTMWYW